MSQNTPHPLTGQSSPKAVTAEQILDALVDLAVDRPHFVYLPPTPDVGCVYTYQGKPSCLVGQAFDCLGMRFPDAGDFGSLTFFDDEGEQSIDDSSISPALVEVLFGPAGHTFPSPVDDVWKVLGSVQSAQDGGTPWAEAVYHAFRTLNIDIPERLATARASLTAANSH